MNPSTTLSLPRVYGRRHAFHYNKLSVVSFILALSFVLYGLALGTNVILFHSFLRFSLFFIIFCPLLAATLSLVSLSQMKESHEQGSALSYVALSISAFYFTIAFSLAFVLLFLYVVYVYIL